MSNTRVDNSVLHIDNIISAQPNIGPNIPDGGYGWIIVVVVSFFKAVIPSIIAGYGTILLYNRIELAPPMDPFLWNVKFMYVPIVYMIASTLADPLSRKLIIGNKWPVYICYAGTCLTCAGLVLLWFAVKNVSKFATIYIFSGILTGIGSSVLRCLCDIIIIQYFKLKLKSVQIVLQVITCIGFIFTPIMLGNYIILNGIAHTLLWYSIIILQGLVVCLLIKKPPYLKNLPTNYKLIKEVGEDEEDIFSKPATELRTTSYSTGSNFTRNEQTSVTIEQQPSTSNTNTVTKETNVERNWETFDDMNVSVYPSNTPNPHESYIADYANDLNNKEQFEDNFTNRPISIYEEIVNCNMNNSTVNEVPTEIQSNIFLPLPEKASLLDELKEVLKEPTTYKSLIHLINFKYSLLTYFTLFPSYLYNKVNYINNYHVTFIFGILSVSGLLLVTINGWLSNNTNKRAIFLAALSWLGSLGYLIISDVRSETLFITGAIFVCFSIFAMDYYGKPLLKLTQAGETTTTHCFLSIITSFSLILFMIADFKFATCFKIMSVLQFANGSMWFSNFIYKRIQSLRQLR